jgi:mono/diheme cytochrome c family protein
MATAMACVKRSFFAAVFAVAWLASANTFAQAVEYNYLLHCGGCHIEDGSGMPPHVPDLRVEMPYFASFTEGRAYMARVPGVVQSPMTTEQLTQVLNLILSLFAPESANLQPYSVDEVTRYQQDALLDPKKLRDELMALRGVAANEDSGSSSDN